MVAIHRFETLVANYRFETAYGLTNQKGVMHEHSASAQNYLWSLSGDGLVARSYGRCAGSHCTRVGHWKKRTFHGGKNRGHSQAHRASVGQHEGNGKGRISRSG